jgi:hypothetical protein
MGSARLRCRQLQANQNSSTGKSWATLKEKLKGVCKNDDLKRRTKTNRRHIRQGVLRFPERISEKMV